MQLQCPVIDIDRPEAAVAAGRNEQTALVMAGLDFRTAPIAVRETVAVAPPRLPGLLRELRAAPGVREAFLLSTCNRTELYVVAASRAAGARALRAAFAALGGAADLGPCLTLREEGAAVRHLCRVAAGLESLVVGEAEIVHQVKEAAALARADGALGPVLQRLIDKALSASKLARTRARHDACGPSVATVAVAACKRIFGALDAVTVLVLGAGETAELTVHALISKGVRRVRIANRTYARAAKLARLVDGEALPLAALPAHLPAADVVICCSASPHPLLTAPLVAAAQTRRAGRRLLILDLAVPRDVEPAVAEVPGVQVRHLDHLCDDAAAATSRREAQLAMAAALVEAEAEKFDAWLAARRARTALARLRDVAGASVARKVLDE